ncbi:MAG: hypothetical protein A2W93_05775 [Bacteroidetes bacterium GWF2_43_63]|nr:MAG: hypothetical protein A2W94_04270 [Bacteroidetes bacterium GWE2_42_42]OFY55928.1 MAG: hypothetical protein A2W93_05775 [Bacteroidetes bacterium GWF2_43_63]
MRAQLSGTYTIDPSQPTGGTNFRYFGDALTALNTIGVNDTTIFNIASGVYDTLLTFSSTIPGMGATAPITFQSATGNTADVVLKHMAVSSSDNYVIDINGAKFISFKNMSLQSNGGTYANCIVLRNSCRNILIEGLLLQGPTTTMISADMALINDLGTSIDSNIVIRNNEFKNGSYGVHMYGEGTFCEHNNIIEGNTFTNYYAVAIQTLYQKYIHICNNYITTNSDNIVTAGMYLSETYYGRVFKNRIVSPQNYGIYLYYCAGDAVTKGEVSNNFVSVGGNSTAYGIYSYYSTNINIYHNSVLCSSTNTSNGRALYVNYGSALNIKNNILSNTGGGYAFYTSTTAFTSDYNNLHTTGAYTGYYNSANRATLADWSLASGKDNYSISVSPGFISHTDLHTFNLLAIDKGIPVGISDDIDGETRSNYTPDIGADEYSVGSNDAGVAAVNEPASSPLPFLNTNYNVSVSLKNYGTDTLTKTTINWSLNGILQPSFIWQDTLLPGFTSGSIVIGTLLFSDAGANSVQAWTTLPNDLADANAGNDTLKKQYLVCPVPLAGSYSINPAQPTTGTNFHSFADVLTVLNVCGLSDTTIFNIASGVYDTLLTFGNAIPGQGPSAPVIFQSATGNPEDVLLRNNSTSTANNFVIEVNGAKFMTFRNLSLQSMGGTYGTCITMKNSCRNITIENNKITGPVATSGVTNLALIYDPNTSADSNIVIRNNTFHNGSFSLYFQGSSVTALENNNIIEGNTFENYYWSGIYAAYQKKLIVSGNSFSTSSAYSNTISVSLSYSDESLVADNTIISPRYYGIYLNYCDGTPASFGEVSNNFVMVGGTSYSIGIYSNYCTYYNYFHNSIRVSGTHATYGKSLQLIGGSNNFVRNNILANFGGGYAIYASNATFKSDFNNLYTTGSKIGYYLGALVATLPDWINAAQNDSNSVCIDPEFISTTDLHTYCLAMDNLGTPLSVSTDIDGESRSVTNPDMGADEYTPSLENAGVVEISEPLSMPNPIKDSIYIAKVRIKNFGADTLTKVTIEWSINNILQSPYAWTGSLLPNEVSGEITIGNAIFTDIGNSVLKAWTILPNDSIDAYNANDSVSKVFNVCKTVFAGSYSIDPGIPTGGSNYRYFDEVLDILNVCGVNDTTVFNIASGVYDTLLTFPKTIPGMGETAPITFQSATGNPSDVVLQHNSTSSSFNYIIGIKGAQHMNFRNMTLRALGLTYGNCFRIDNNAGFIVIEGNVIEGPSTTLSNTNLALIYDVSGYNDSNIVIRNNTLLNGSYGIHGTGMVTTSMTNSVTIENNIITGYYDAGIRLSYYKNAQIRNNQLTTNSAYTSSVALYLYYCDYCKSSSNKINQFSGRGVSVTYCDGSSSARSEISNNFISVGGSVGSSIFYLSNSTYHNVFHNSINYWGPNAATNAFTNENSSYTNIQNNIFSNAAGGRAIFLSGSGISSDYNNLHTAGQYIGSFNFAAIPTFAEWISYTGLDSNSVQQNPYFASQQDLHVSTLALNGSGTPVGITTDIDDEIRSSTTPDIGADEFTPGAQNAGITEILSPLEHPFPIQDTIYPVIVTIRNFATDTLSKATIKWSVNGILQPSYSWTGSLLPDESISSITIGTLAFANTGNNVVEVWTTLPNDSSDSFVFNDTCTKTYFVCKTVFAGNYSIDPLQPTAGNNYQYFSQVLAILNECGVGDTTVFNIASGVYDTLLTFTGAIPGIGPDAPITFQSASGVPSDVVLQHSASTSSDNYVVDLNGARYLTFKNMTLKALDIYLGNCVVFRNNSRNNTLEGNIITGIATTSTNVSMAVVINKAASLDSNIVIRNNILINGSFGIYCYGTSSSSLERNNVIEGNTISNYYVAGIQSFYQTNISISNNVISTNSVNATQYGIYLQYNDFSQIEKNRINIPKYNGLYLYYCDANSTNRGLVSNNFITVEGASNANGMIIQYTNYYNFYHNSVNCTSSGTTPSRAFYYYNSNNCEIKNNILANTGGGYAFHSTYGNFISDYNDLYATGVSLGYFSGTNIATLAEWNAATLMDSNSVSIDPLFSSPSDLHVSSHFLNNEGFPVGIIDDIDGESRNVATPDIGADEFIVPAEDAGVVEITEPVSSPVPLINISYPVKFKIRNFGSDTLSKVTVEWSLNGTIQPSYFWTGQLLPDSISPELNIGTIVFTLTGNNVIEAWTSMPNDSIDLKNINDTIKKTYTACEIVLAGTYTIDPLLPSAGTNFQYFSDFLSVLNTCGLRDTTVINIASGVYDTLLIFTANIPGLGQSAPLTIQSLTGNPADVTIQRNSTTAAANFIIDISGASFITLRNLTLKALNANYGRCVSLRNSCSIITIENNVIEGPSSYQLSSTLALIYNSETSNDHSILIRNNTIVNGSYGIYMSGISSSNTENNNTIEDNNISNYCGAGIYSRYQTNTILKGNSLESGSTYPSINGLYLNYCYYPHISDNRITQNYTGISLNYCYNSAAEHGEVFNNFISIGGTQTAYGIFASNSSFFDVYHNSANVYSTQASSSVSFRYVSGNDFDIRNNIFSNPGGGYAFSAQINNFNSDYNNFYTTGPNIGFLSSSAIATLSDWIVAAVSDTNSVAVDPAFISQTNLHTASTILNNAGAPVGILHDIDGDPRSATNPDIGADEYNPFRYDLEIISIMEPDFIQPENSVTDARFIIINNGSETVYSIPWQYTYNSGSSVTNTWNGVLQYNETDTLTISSLTVNPDLNILQVSLSLPEDTIFYNNSKSKRFFGVPSHIFFEDNDDSVSELYSNSPVWEYGFPAATVINYPFNSQAVWTTNLDGNYPDSVLAFLNLPSFNFSGISSAYLSFYYWLDTQENQDGSFIQYSVNNGTTWGYLGSINDVNALNWYDAHFSGHSGWSLNTGGWKQACIPLTNVIGNATVRLRFGFYSDATMNYNGMAIDNIRILTPEMPFDAGVKHIVSPMDSTQADSLINVQVVLQNYGTDTLHQFYVSYKIPENSIFNAEQWTGTLIPGDSAVFTFSNPYTGPHSTYTLCAYTSVSGDIYRDNDSACISMVPTGTNGIDQTNSNLPLALNIHPNPASTQTEISFTLPAPGKCVLTLHNTLGELIQTTTIDGQSGENSVNVDLSRLGQGIYVYTLEYKDVVLTRRLSVIK